MMSTFSTMEFKEFFFPNFNFVNIFLHNDAGFLFQTASVGPSMTLVL